MTCMHQSSRGRWADLTTHSVGRSAHRSGVRVRPAFAGCADGPGGSAAPHRPRPRRRALWKARGRLNGATANDPHNVALLDRLGDVCFAMGDLPAAGRAWRLSGRDDDRAEAALAAFEERAPAPAERLWALGALAPLDR